MEPNKLSQRKEQESVTKPDHNLPNMEFKISTLNFCLGLQLKKNLEKETLMSRISPKRVLDFVEDFL